MWIWMHVIDTCSQTFYLCKYMKLILMRSNMRRWFNYKLPGRYTVLGHMFRELCRCYERFLLLFLQCMNGYTISTQINKIEMRSSWRRRVTLPAHRNGIHVKLVNTCFLRIPAGYRKQVEHIHIIINNTFASPDNLYSFHVFLTIYSFHLFVFNMVRGNASWCFREIYNANIFCF